MWVVLAWEVAGTQVVAFVVGSVTTGSVVLGLVDKRRREITQTWRELAEAKTAEANDCDERMTKLDQQLTDGADAKKGGISRRILDALARLEAR